MNTPDWILEELLSDHNAWYDYASCLGVYDEYDAQDLDDVLFPFNPRTRNENAIEAFTREFCSTCPVRDQCIDFASRTESVGVWGGVELTSKKTQRLHRLRNQTRRVTVDLAEEVLGE